MSEGRDRRGFLQTAAIAGLSGLFAQKAVAGPGAAELPAQGKVGVFGSAGAGPGRPRIAMLVHPRMIMQDLIGPLTVFNIMRSEIHLVWKTLEPVGTETGLTVLPSTRFVDCPRDLDVLFCPGGLEGTVACIEDPEIVAFIRDRGLRARYVTSDCTGSLLLGAAGLLQGYRAASHWAVTDQLALYGAIPSRERVAVDRNRVTGGGVTAGIDFGLALAAMLQSEEQAQAIQLTIEYAPAPPFQAGSPETAPAALVEKVRQRRAPAVEAARRAGIAAAAKLKT